MSFDHHIPFSAPIIFRASIILWRIFLVPLPSLVHMDPSSSETSIQFKSVASKAEGRMHATLHKQGQVYRNSVRTQYLYLVTQSKENGLAVMRFDVTTRVIRRGRT